MNVNMMVCDGGVMGDEATLALTAMLMLWGGLQSSFCKSG
jgi:hypothetical protein